MTNNNKNSNRDGITKSRPAPGPINTPPGNYGPAKPVSMRGTWLLITLISLALYFTLGTYRNWPYKIASDGKYYYQYLLSLVQDGDIDFSNNYSVKKEKWMNNPIDHYKFKERLNPETGKPANLFTIGPAILWSPFYLVTQAGGKVANAVGADIDTNPWSRYSQYGVMLAGIFFTILGLFILRKLMMEFFQSGPAAYTVCLLLLGTNLVYYAVIEPSMSHAYDFSIFAIYVFAIHKLSRLFSGRYKWAASAAGVLAGLAILVRTQNIVSIGIMSLYLTHRLYKQKKLKVLLYYCTAMAITASPLVFVNLYLSGKVFAVAQGSQFIRPFEPHLLGLLFSVKNGLFSTHPVLLAGLVGMVLYVVHLVKSKHSHSFFIGALLMCFVSQAYINSTIVDWWAGHAFGQRRLTGLLVVFAFGFAYLFQLVREHKPKWNRGLQVVITLCVGFNLYIMLIYIFLENYAQPHFFFHWLTPAQFKELYYVMRYQGVF
ncbi:MAG: hypothetical protein GY765_07085 [bacterium]|nr:hypothetical protein [bacterium]